MCHTWGNPSRSLGSASCAFVVHLKQCVKTQPLSTQRIRSCLHYWPSAQVWSYTGFGVHGICLFMAAWSGTLKAEQFSLLTLVHDETVSCLNGEVLDSPEASIWSRGHKKQKCKSIGNFRSWKNPAFMISSPSHNRKIHKVLYYFTCIVLQSTLLPKIQSIEFRFTTEGKHWCNRKYNTNSDTWPMPPARLL